MPLVLLIGELARWGEFPAGWEAYLTRAGKHVVKTLGPCENQRQKGST